MNPVSKVVCSIVALGICVSTIHREGTLDASQPAASSLSAWLSGAGEAMGGEEKLRALAAIETSGVSVWYHREQSERPEGPWLTSFTDFTDVRSFRADAVLRRSRARGFSTNDWVDSSDWTSLSTILVASGVGGTRGSGTSMAVGTPPDLEALPVGLTPERVILAARDAPDIHLEPDEVVDGYLHHVVAFSFSGARVRLILNVPSLLPKAVEITSAHPYNMFLAPWGDVTQRVTFGMWTIEPDGLRYPRLWAFSTNGQPDGSLSVTRVRANPPIDESDFTLPQEGGSRLIAARPRIADLPFGLAERPPRELAPEIVAVPGKFGVVEVKQDAGVVIIEAPLSSEYSVKAIADAQRRFGGAPIKAVITTSDAWPHIGGIREYVARGIPIYALDLDAPILTRLIAARYESSPDALAKSPMAPRLRAVTAETSVGSGSGRLKIYPFRTATGERQMMIYWPAHGLLYTSDLFTIRKDFVFLPQQVGEAVAAVAREHLDVATAFGMHYEPVPWTAVLESAAPPKRTPR
jgi:glyoxylase-like metal-dependent hydrolase (beta-lactamase superfamily II)